MANYYEILGLTPWASEVQIRRAYRELSKLYHPDTTQLSPEVAVPKFQAINSAYTILSNPERRNIYDQQIHFSRLQYVNSLDNFSSLDNDGLPSDRPLSGGELFALLLIGITFVVCLGLVFISAWLRSFS
jgi:DnaJ-class molecular chaperone with C-terminal Zn finger domain